MAIHEIDWCTLEIPDEWEFSQDEDDVIVIEDEDAVSCIEIFPPVIVEEGEVSDADIAEFSAELREAGLRGKRVRVGGWQGELFEHEDEEHHWREWFLRQGNCFVQVACHCLAEHAGMDDAAVDEILATLEPRAD